MIDNNTTLEGINPWGYYGGSFDLYRESNNLNDLFVGHTVTKVADDMLQLDDGRRMRLIGNDGGCSCGAGDYYLTDLNDMPNNVITNVKVVRRTAEDDDKLKYDEATYEIFVLADDSKINTRLAAFEGSDGNGYYGTGFTIYVEKAQ